LLEIDLGRGADGDDDPVVADNLHPRFLPGRDLGFGRKRQRDPEIGPDTVLPVARAASLDALDDARPDFAASGGIRCNRQKRSNPHRGK